MSLGLTLTYDDLGIQRAAAGLAALGGDLQGEVLAPIGALLESTTLERFDTNIGPDGQAWVPSLRARLASGKTLVDKGHLRDSVHYELDGDAVEIGSAYISAGVHQFGATITAKGGGPLKFKLADGSFRSVASVTIPARPFVGLSAEDADLVIGVAGDAISRAFDATVG